MDIIPTRLDHFLKQENRFFIDAEGTKLNCFRLKVYLETLLNHPSNNPYEQLLIQTLRSKNAQSVQDPLLQRVLKLIVNDKTPNPPLPLLNEFEEIALEGNYQMLEARADSLISLSIDAVRDPLMMMLGNTITTRKGLSSHHFEPFISADPIAIKQRIIQHSKKFSAEQIQHWVTHCSGRAIDYFREKESQDVSA